MSALRRMLSSRIARARAAEKRSALEGEIAVVNSRKEKNRASSVSRTQQHTSQFSLSLSLSLWIRSAWPRTLAGASIVVASPV